MEALANPTINQTDVNLEAQRRQMQSLGKQKGTPEQERAKMQSACEGFEAIFIQKMWDEMRSSLPKEGLMHSKEEETWQGMYSQELGKSMAKNGGIGLADMMMKQLTKNRDDLADASDRATPRRVGMDVPPVPLLPPSLREKEKAAQSEKTAVQMPVQQAAKPAVSLNDLYEGEAAQPNGDAEETPVYTVAQANAEQATLQAGAVAGEGGAGEASPLLRQTLDDLRAQMAAQGLEVPGAVQAAETKPVVHTFTYTTNLPASQRQGMEKILAAANPVRQNQAQQENAVPGAQAGAAALQQNAQAAAETARQVQPARAETFEKPAALLPPGVPSPEEDILAGIKVRYQPLPLLPTENRAPGTLLAARTDAAEALQEGGLNAGAGIRQVADVYTPVTSPVYEPVKQRPVSPVPGIARAVARLGENMNAPQEAHAISLAENTPSPLAEKLRPVRAGGPALFSPLSAPEQKNISAADLGRLNLATGSVNPPVKGEISSGFGWRLDPLSGERTWHNGVDIRAEAGAPVRASMGGRVSFAGQDAELGNLVIVDHPGGLQSYYGHNENLLVKVGDKIEEGMELAKAGSSGRASGTHVHFELRRNNLPLNPEPVLAQGVTKGAPIRVAKQDSKGASHV